MYIKIHFYLFVLLAYVFYKGKLEIFMLFYLSAFTHEVAHVVVSLLLGVEVMELYFLPFGINAKYENRLSERKEILISMAGPIMSLFLALFSKNAFVRMVNFVIMLLNLVPIYPLDGGRIQKCIFVKIFGYAKGMKMSEKVSDLFLVLFLIIAILMGWKFRNYHLLLLTIYLFFLSKSEIKKDRILRIINYLQIE